MKISTWNVHKAIFIFVGGVDRTLDWPSRKEMSKKKVDWSKTKISLMIFGHNQLIWKEQQSHHGTNTAQDALLVRKYFIVLTRDSQSPMIQLGSLKVLI